MNVFIKGFGRLNAYLDTVDGGISPVGELSTQSKTFSIDKDVLRDPTKDAGEAVIFHSKGEDKSDYAIPTSFKDEILDIIETVNGFDDQSTAEAQFNAVFNAKPWTDVVIGPSVLGNAQNIPAYVLFKTVIGLDTIEFKLWFADSTFQTEYDEWSILLVPPVDDLNSLWGTYADVSNALVNVKLTDRLSKVEPLKAGNPETKLMGSTITWQDRADNSRLLQTEWTVIGYGPKSSAQENIMEAVREYLVDNSSYTIEQWVEHFPEIVALDSYTFIPLWDQPAISVAGQSESVFNPSIAYADVVPRTQLVIPALSETEIQNRADITSILYKSIGFIVMGEAANAVDAIRFTDRFTDYAVLATNDANINRLSETTKQVIQGLERLARQCEVDDGISALPADMNRITTGQLTLVTLTIGTAQLKMGTKNSYMAVVNAV